MAHQNQDPEMGTTEFFVPQSPDSDIGERLADKSGSTDQSSLDPEQPTKPLIFEKYMINGNQNPHITTSIPEKKDNSGKKTHRKRRGIKERVFCIIGLFTLLAGLALIAVALFLIKDNECNNTNSDNSDVTATDPLTGEYKHKNNPGSNNKTVTSRISKKSTERVTTSSTTSTIATTTYMSFAHLVNIAKGKEAFQSSIYRSQESGLVHTASAAVDGSPDISINSGHCSQTNAEENPVWWVDLGTFQIVKRIRIRQAKDCCTGSLSNFEIRVGQQQDLAMNVLCRYYMGAALSPIVDIQCERLIYGRYVSIQLLQVGPDNEKRQLTLCEVEIYKS